MSTHSCHTAVPLVLVAGTMVLTAAACGGGGGSGSSPTSTSPAPATVTATTTQSTTTQSTTTQSTTAPATTAGTSAATSATPTARSTATGGTGGSTCTVRNLRIRYADDPGGGAAGSVYGTLTFTNSGSGTCTLRGYPGVSYVGGGNGTQVGQPASRTGDPVTTKTLRPGKSAKAQLRRTQPGNYGEQCGETKVDGLRVYPPGSTRAAFVAFPTTGCKSTSAPLLQVGPVR